MGHVEFTLQKMWQGLLGVVTFTAVIPRVLQVASLEAAIGGAAALLAAASVLLVISVKRDIEEQLSEMETKLDSGFKESLNALDNADETNYPPQTDGGGEWREVRGLNVEKMDFSGIPSVAGAGALGALGALFGPGGAAAGALIGALAGGGKEYQDLKEEHKRRLETAAWAAVKRETPIPGQQFRLEDVTDKTELTNDYWIFKFVDHSGRIHFIRISKNDGTVQYRPPEEDPAGPNNRGPY